MSADGGAGRGGTGAEELASRSAGFDDSDGSLPILALGTITVDTVETPGGRSEGAAGGSALYFAVAAGLLAPVRVLGVVGDDAPDDGLALMRERGADLSGVARLRGATMRWHARYGPGPGERTTLDADRGVLDRWEPEVPRRWRATPFVFLGSTSPRLQAVVLDQLDAPDLVVADSMGHWIRDRRAGVEAVARRSDLFLCSEEECRLLGEDDDVAVAAEAVRDLGPRRVVVKRGERGATAYGPEAPISVPVRRVERVVDPTGAGDAFAGGLVAWLARHGTGAPDAPGFRRALAAGAAAGAGAVSGFSVDGLARMDADDVLAGADDVEERAAAAEGPA